MTSIATPTQFARLAWAQLGKPYILGAEAKHDDPSPRAFDCSELVEWLYARSGNKITDLAAAQYEATKPVKGTPKPGDLVFLKNNPKRSNGIGHVAVVVGPKVVDGKIVDWWIAEARGRKYGVVKTTLSYWKSRKFYVGLRRLPSFKLAPEPTPAPKPATPKPITVPATVKRGSVGSVVKILQRYLKLRVDGVFGPVTEAAVRAFQKKHGLEVDGVVGPKTWREIM